MTSPTTYPSVLFRYRAKMQDFFVHGFFIRKSGLKMLKIYNFKLFNLKTHDTKLKLWHFSQHLFRTNLEVLQNIGSIRRNISNIKAIQNLLVLIEIFRSVSLCKLHPIDLGFILDTR